MVLVRPWVLVSIPMPLRDLGEAAGALRWMVQVFASAREQNGNVLAAGWRALSAGVDRRQCRAGANPSRQAMIVLVSLGARDVRGPLISAQQCRTYSAACIALGLAADISSQRATILLAMSRSWDTLGYEKDLYDTMLEEEGNSAKKQRRDVDNDGR
jgi:hypothetical protein